MTQNMSSHAAPSSTQIITGTSIVESGQADSRFIPARISSHVQPFNSWVYP